MNAATYRRGMILDVLRYNRGLEMPIAFMQLLMTLHRMNYPLTSQELREDLEYMAEKDYVHLTRRSDLPGYQLSRLRGNERPDQIVTVKLSARGMDLHDGVISDAGVAR